MAWSAPRTFTTGEVVTASMMNAMRDNFNETAPAKVTTAGDLVYATGANALARLPAGNASQVLIGGPTPAFGRVPLDAPSRLPYLRLGLSADLTVANATSTAVPWTQELSDWQGWHVDGATTVTIGQAGIYVIAFMGGFANNASATMRSAHLWLNDAAVLGEDDIDNASANVYAMLKIVTVAALALNDQISVKVRQTSGSSLAFSASPYPRLSLAYLGPAT
jgi:hypothetical protein